MIDLRVCKACIAALDKDERDDLEIMLDGNDRDDLWADGFAPCPWSPDLAQEAACDSAPANCPFLIEHSLLEGSTDEES